MLRCRCFVQTLQNLRTLIAYVLQEAERVGAKSIAIPPIGTGNLGYPAKLVARTIVAETSSFLSSSGQGTLLDIRLVVPPAEHHLLDVSLPVINE